MRFAKHAKSIETGFATKLLSLTFSQKQNYNSGCRSCDILCFQIRTKLCCLLRTISCLHCVQAYGQNLNNMISMQIAKVKNISIIGPAINLAAFGCLKHAYKINDELIFYLWVSWKHLLLNSWRFGETLQIYEKLAIDDCAIDAKKGA